MQTVTLPNGETVPQLGLGTWRMGERQDSAAVEITALKLGIELGLTLIDTAEMYGEGGAEKIVAQAIKGRREQIFLVSKVYPHNATRQGVVQACERSLQRLQTDRIDLYLLHWRGSVPLAETVLGFEDLAQAGKIRHWGVSNFDVSDMEELNAVPMGTKFATNQILYNLAHRGIEWDLLPWQRQRRIPAMAYSPIDQGQVLRHNILKKIAARKGASPAQVALRWVLRQPDMIVIPKTSQLAHVRENRAVLDLQLDEVDLVELDQAFPPPKAHQPLEMI